MRPSARAIHTHLIALIALALCASANTARGDDRAEARAHFQAGMKAYDRGDYRGALTEFGTAQTLSPADLNYYNFAICHDKLGEAEPAIQNYREYLRRVPDAPKRVEIEASIARLDDALRSAAKKAEDAKRAEVATRADADKLPAEGGSPMDGTVPAAQANDLPSGPGVPSGAGASGTPSTGLTVTTGDAQLDRVSAINIEAIRAQRGLADRTPGAGPGATTPGNSADAARSVDAPTAKPIYKEWWFWAIVAVGAVVAYEVATGPSNSTPQIEGRDEPPSSARVPLADVPLFRF